MGIKERKTTEKEVLKQKIIEAAVLIIQEEGYEKLSIRKIAKIIDYSPTTIYLYYEDKAQIISDMTEMIYTKVMDDVYAVLAEHENAPIDVRIQHMIYTFVMGLCKESEMTKTIMFSGQNVIFSNDNTGGVPTNADLSRLTKLLEEGALQGIFRPDAASTSWILVSALLGFVLCAIENNLHKLDNFHESILQMINIILGGIKA